MNSLLVGCGTHFNQGIIEEDKLSLLSPRCAVARMDFQDSTVSEMLQGIAQVRRVTPYPMLPQVILNKVEMIEDVPLDVPIEWMNERDITLGKVEEGGTPRMDPKAYRKSLLDAYEVTKRTGHTLVGGIIANPLLSDWVERMLGRSRGLTWLQEMGFHDLPEDIVFGMHRYEHANTFVNAHPPFKSRDEEWEAIRKTVGEKRRIWVTEGPGYDVTQGADWNRTAEQIRLEIAHYASKGVERYIWYQIRDSKTDDHDFGLFDEQDRLKQVIFDALPLRSDITNNGVVMVADVVILRSCLIPLDAYGKPGKFSANVKPADARMVAVDQNGTVYANPTTSVGGAFETFSISGDVACFDETGGDHVYGIRIV